MRYKGALILVAGHYCHDTLIGNDGAHRALGGSAAYASAILEAFGEPYQVVAKVGEDFLYAGQVLKKPAVVQGRTTSFVDDYRSGERRERVDAVCEPLKPEDLQGSFDVGIACGVSCEVTPAALSRIREISRVVVADAQGLLREIAPGGEVVLRGLHPDAPACIDYLKASRAEAALLDVQKLRRSLTLLVTDGPRGCDILERERLIHVPAFEAKEKDPTGAGDCFLAGLAVGLARGLEVAEAARIGAWCAARAVEVVGVPSPRTFRLPPGA